MTRKGKIRKAHKVIDKKARKAGKKVKPTSRKC